MFIVLKNQIFLNVVDMRIMLVSIVIENIISYNQVMDRRIKKIALSDFGLQI